MISYTTLRTRKRLLYFSKHRVPPYDSDSRTSSSQRRCNGANGFVANAYRRNRSGGLRDDVESFFKLNLKHVLRVRRERRRRSVCKKKKPPRRTYSGRPTATRHSASVSRAPRTFHPDGRTTRDALGRFLKRRRRRRVDK